MPGAPLSLLDREEISVALIESCLTPWAAIARRIGRAASTISREVNRNGGRGRYRPAAAQARADSCLGRPKQPVLARSGPLRDRVTAELTLGRSPDAIWADLDAEGLERVCTETIYQGVYGGILDVKAPECLRSRRPRRRPRQARHQAHNKADWPSITGRPAEIGDRSEAGHWEADLIIGAHNRSAMLWLAERVTRYAIGVAMPNGYNAANTLTALIEALEHVPAHLARSVTFDRGSEWSDWKPFAGYHDLNVWFCEPHSPWQRGQIENQNRQWRWWYPRGTDLSIVTQDHINAVAALINGQRRRLLDYQSPTNLYHDLTVH